MAGYSQTPLGKKLGLKDGMRALLLNVPSSLVEICDYPGFSSCESVVPGKMERRFDYIHLFAVDRDELARLAPSLRGCLAADGMIWISWPKKASKVRTTLTEDVLRQVLLPTGLVDVKVAAVDEVWSGLKFMFRKEIRGTL